MGPPFHIQNLSLFRSHKQVLDQASLDVAAGEIVCLLGPSGSGKSSLLRCINRLTEPPPATIFMAETDITTLDVLALRRQVGMVFQQASLFPGSVADNIAYGASLQKQALDAVKIAHFLAAVDLPSDIAGQDSHTLSGGQAQRVAIARSLATEPTALLLDEPTSALDPASTRRIEETMLKLRQTLGLTVLWVTHSPEQAQRVADRIYLLSAGKIIDEGEPGHLFKPGSKHLAADFAAGELE